MQFVLYVGEDKTGKTSMSRSLEGLLHSGCKKRTMILSFADELREELIKYYGIPRVMVFDKRIDKDSTIIRFCGYSFIPEAVSLWLKHNLVKTSEEFYNYSLSLRELLITHGTMIRREEDPNYWVNKFGQRVASLKGETDIVAVDDTRYETEFSFFDDKKCLIFYLSNSNNRESNHAQNSVNEWLFQNKTKITKKIEVPIPLLKYSADQINKKHVLPHILSKDKPKRGTYGEFR